MSAHSQSVDPVDQRHHHTQYDWRMKVTATVATVLLGGLSLFQIGLALGAPWGAASWGGTHRGVLPKGFRIASGVAGLVLYPFLALVILRSAGVLEAEWLPGDGSVWMWVLAGFFGLGTLANAASRSRPERWWSPVSGVVAICCGIIASNM